VLLTDNWLSDHGGAHLGISSRNILNRYAAAVLKEEEAKIELNELLWAFGPVKNRH
jgi:hypothetical protein